MAAEEQTMAQQPGERNPHEVSARHVVGEWFWRFLALVMVLTVGWVVWIAYQISPPAIFTPAAFQAAAQARAAQPTGKGPTHGAIKSRSAAATASSPGTPAEGTPPAVTAASVPSATNPAPVMSGAAAKGEVSHAAKAPPVNLEKLRMFEAIETPLPGSNAARAGEGAAKK